jgi:cyanophycinase-like exopeptidase
MKKITIVLFISLLFGYNSQSQTYTSYFTGNTENVSPEVSFGICLMGGGTENDEAMTRFLEHSGGGDIVVIRTTGTDGYNNYIYSGLSTTVNSVETLVLDSREAANDSYVEQQLRNAEAIWIAGGNQHDYISYWKGTATEDALNDHLNVKQAPIGGTSAGMAIMSAYYFSAENGTAYSDEALQNPYNNYMTIGGNDFINAPFLQNVITDTHYDNPDRQGRHMAFMARMSEDFGIRPYGIACDEYTAVFIDAEGKAAVYGQGNYEDYAYFLQSNCETSGKPEVCEAGEPLSWNLGEAAVKVYVIKGEEGGDNYLDLNDWKTGNGGNWQNWYVIEGELFSKNSEAPDCGTSTGNINFEEAIIFPNPAKTRIGIKTLKGQKLKSLSIYNLQGKKIAEFKNPAEKTSVDVSFLKNGIYFLSLEGEHLQIRQKLIIQR